MDRNLLFGNGSGDYNFTNGGSDYAYTRGTTISGAPLFVNSGSAGFDARLGAGSPAINAGLNLSSSFATDIDGAARSVSGAWDLGAYRYGIVGNSVPVTSLHKVPGGITLAWSSMAGKIYRVAFMNNLTDPLTDLNGNITAAGSSTAWTDTTAGASQHRFYVVYVLN